MRARSAKMYSGNPALSEDLFRAKAFAAVERDGEPMTLEGTVNKAGLLLVIVIVSAVFGGYIVVDLGVPISWIAGLAAPLGLLVATLVIQEPEHASVGGPLYAVIEGTFLGAVSARLELAYPGIVAQAVSLTAGVFVLMLLLYKTRLLKPTQNFLLGLTTALGALGLLYLGTVIARSAGAELPYLHEGGVRGILLSVAIVTLAALTLVMDFDFIENGPTEGIPKYMEWYAAFGLMVSLIWLYVEILRLLVKSRSRR